MRLSQPIFMAIRAFKLEQERVYQELANSHGESDRRLLVCKQNPEDRFSFMAHARSESKRRTLTSDQFCNRCWLKKFHCVCHLMPVIPSNFRLLVYMHTREYGKFSNTGRIMLGSFTNSHLYLAGVREQEQEFQNMLASCDASNSLVLFPSVDSISVESWLAGRLSEQGSSSTNGSSSSSNSGIDLVKAAIDPVSSSAPHEDLADQFETMSLQNSSVQPLTIVVVDGTWSEAKRMVKGVPHHVPRVHLSPTAPSRFKLRKQSQSNRICTLEATALLLQELDPDSNIPSKLLTSFDAVVAECMRIKTGHSGLED